MQRTVFYLLTVVFALTHQVGCYAQSPEGKASQPESASQATEQSLSEVVKAAQASFQQGDYSKAEELATAAIAQQPKNARLHMLMADIRFIAGDIPGAIESYDNVIKFQPESKPFLWQRGLAHYYAGKFQDGKAQFETHQTVNSQDVENAVWHLLCAAKVENLDAARKKLIPIERDTRVPMKEIYELFAGRLKPEQVIEVAQAETQNKLPLYYANLYIGLYHEMLGQEKLARQFIGAAVDQSPGTKNNLMMQLARIHQELRASPAGRHTAEPKIRPNTEDNKKKRTDNNDE